MLHVAWFTVNLAVIGAGLVGLRRLCRDVAVDEVAVPIYWEGEAARAIIAGERVLSEVVLKDRIR